MAMGLSATEHDVLELRPQAFGDWIDSGEGVDALVLDLDSPHLAAAAVVNLRAHAVRAPVLLVSSDREGWEDRSIGGLAAVTVLPLPITRPALLAALGELLASDVSSTDDDPVAQALAELTLDRDLVQDPETGLDPLDLLIQEAPTPDPPPAHSWSPTPPGASEVLEPGRPQDPQSSATTTPTRARRSPRHASPGAQRGQLPAAITAAALHEIAALRATTQKPEPPSATAMTEHPDGVAKSTAAVGTVRHLTAQIEALYGVPETAEVIARDALERVPADASAVLVPDGAQWRVAAGTGLRPIETRIRLGPDSWLVQQIAQAHMGAIIEETDIAREQLQGVPLASWRHLLAAPIREVEAIIMLARDDGPPFEERELAALAKLGTEAGPLLSAAMDTRSLSRLLSEFRDVGEFHR